MAQMIKVLPIIMIGFMAISCNQEQCIEEQWSSGNLRGQYCFNNDSTHISGYRFNEGGDTTDHFFLRNGKAYNAHYYHDKIQMISECIVFWNNGFPGFSENGLRITYSEEGSAILYVQKNFPHGKFLEFDSDGNIVVSGEYYYNKKNGTWKYYDRNKNLIRIERFETDSLIRNYH